MLVLLCFKDPGGHGPRQKRRKKEAWKRAVELLEDVKNILRIEVRKSLLHIHHYELGTNVFSKDKLNKSMLRVNKEEEKL